MPLAPPIDAKLARDTWWKIEAESPVKSQTLCLLCSLGTVAEIRERRRKTYSKLEIGFVMLWRVVMPLRMMSQRYWTRNLLENGLSRNMLGAVKSMDHVCGGVPGC